MPATSPTDTVMFRGEGDLQRRVNKYYETHPDYMPGSTLGKLQATAAQWTAGSLLLGRKMVRSVFNIEDRSPQMDKFLDQWFVLLSLKSQIPGKMTEKNRQSFLNTGVELLRSAHEISLHTKMGENRKLTVSGLMEKVLQADILYHTKLMAKNKETVAQINPYKGVFRFLDEEDIHPFHSFAISAMKGTPFLTMPYSQLEENLQKKMISLVGSLTAYAAQKQYRNTATLNVLSALKTVQNTPQSKKAHILSEVEGEILTEAIRNLTRDDLPRTQAFSSLYSGEEITFANIKRNHDGLITFRAEDLPRNELDTLIGNLETSVPSNDKTVSAISAVLEELINNNKSSKDFHREVTLQMIRSGILALPSGQAITMVLELFKTLSEPEICLDPLMALMDLPQVRLFRFHLATELLQLIDGYQGNRKLSESDSAKYRERLYEVAKKNGISLDPNQPFSLLETPEHVDIIMERFNACMSGQAKGKEMLSAELKKMVESPSYVPLMYLDGQPGTGKTSFGLKLAQEINANRLLQQRTSGLEKLDAQVGSATFYNASILQFLDTSFSGMLDEEQQVSEFQNHLLDNLKEASANAQQNFPERPSIIIFDEIGNVVETTYKEMSRQKLSIFLDLLQELKFKQQVTDPRTGECYKFPRPIVFLTSNISADQEGDPFGSPLFTEEYAGKRGLQLKDHLAQDRTVTFSPLNTKHTAEQLQYYMETLIPTAAAFKGYLVRIESGLVEVLAKKYAELGFMGRDVFLHIRHNLLDPLVRREEIPSTEMVVSLNPQGLDGLSYDSLTSNLDAFKIQAISSTP